MADKMIKITNLSKNYHNKRALDNVNLELESGNIIGLLGPNGSGKTTLIKTLTGLINDYTGYILIDGREVGPYTKSVVSYLPDHEYFGKWMKTKDMIEFFKDFYSDFDVEKMNRMLETMKIDPNQPIKELSKGNKDKLQLALTMSRNAKVYILDEPIGGVDPAARELIINTIINAYNPGSLVIIATHLIDEIESVLNYIVFLKNGEIVRAGDADTIREETNMSINDLFKEDFKC